jgi:hypothetical protein
MAGLIARATIDDSVRQRMEAELAVAQTPPQPAPDAAA